MKIGIVGGGAAGCLCAILAKRRLPQAGVTVFEAGPRLLAKVALTGGGRCNLTNSFRDIERLETAYPRGAQLMRRALRVLSPEDTMRWFEGEGVRLTTQDDQCVFPVSQDAMQVVHTLERGLREAGVRVVLNAPVERILALPEGGFLLRDDRFDRVVVATGGTAREKLERLLPEGVVVTDTVPSLFTLKIPDDGLRALMGTVVPRVALSLAGTKFRAAGTLLITDWGVSGPATLRLSSYAARHLAGSGYNGTLLVNWLDAAESDARKWISATAAANPRKQVSATPPEGITARLWRHLTARATLREDLRWAELGSRGSVRLAATLTADTYPVDGRARFKEEFVTCGGVDLAGVSLNSLESKQYPGLFFAGEALDLDAVTGGFNLQAAWSTAAVVASSL